MKATKSGRTVTLTMTTREAAELENELLWGAHDDDQTMKAAWEALSDLNDEAAQR